MATKKISREQCVDFGQLLVLILLLLSLRYTMKAGVWISCILLLINMTVPLVYYPMAWLWYNLGEQLGNIVSRVTLSIIFFIVVVPVGLIRNMLGKDSLTLRQFKKGKHSVFKDRGHQFVADDLKNGF